MEQDKKGGFGTVVGITIIIIVLLVGALYFFQQRIEKSREFQNILNQGEIATTSDEISDIEKDINSMDLESLGSGIDNL